MARGQLNLRVDPIGHLTAIAALRAAAAFAVLVVGFFLLGQVGLQLQSVQTGVTLVWPASGFAFAIVYWFGQVQALAILPAMLAIAWTVGLPWEVAALAALGAMLEAGVPAWLLRRTRVDPRLRHLRDVLLFIAFVPLLGPAFSASLGTLAFHVLGDSDFDALHLWLLWWLGNSVGMLLVGGFGLVVVARRSLQVRSRELIELLIAGAAVVLVTGIGLSQASGLTSPLILFLLTPVFVLVAQRGDQYSVMVLGIVAMAVVLLSASRLSPAILEQSDLGILYLDISLLWVVVFTGMITSSARQEVNARHAVAWLAVHDPLTRLLNRHAFMEHLAALLPVPAEQGTGHVLMLLDLDRFKDLNDAEGHRAGDQVLREVGALLGQEVRAGDIAARLGGDEFAVLLEDCELLQACAVAENVRSDVEGYEYKGRRGMQRVEASIGLVQLATRHDTPEDVLHEADSACYDAKRAGRNRVFIYSREALEDAG